MKVSEVNPKKRRYAGIFPGSHFIEFHQVLSHVLHCQYATLGKKSEKTNKPIPGKACNSLTVRRTDKS